MKKKWLPISEKIVETTLYKYVIGWYNHEEYGNGCFRVSKFLKENGYFIGHFVIVPDDFDEVSNEIMTIMTKRRAP